MLLAPTDDPAIACDRCQAVCCRLPVLLMPGDRPPDRFVAEDGHGLAVMATDDDGWCAALDRQRMCCSIYPVRPRVCRDFPEGGADCRDERRDWGYRDGVAPA